MMLLGSSDDCWAGQGLAGCDLWKCEAGTFQPLLFLLSLSYSLREALGLGREVMGRVTGAGQKGGGSGAVLTSGMC